MDGTSKKLVGLLESSDIELRMSAIRITCELRLDSKQVIRSLARCLREEPPLREAAPGHSVSCHFLPGGKAS